jgi:precorrin-6Y C5,15-methyltransferase (decarboxylating)
VKPRRAVSVVGIGADGCASLSSRAVSAVARAQVLVGGSRHLAFFPQFKGEKIVVGSGVSEVVERIAALADEHSVCLLASGDPMFFGLGSKIVERIGIDHVDVIPYPSSASWAFARAGLRADDAVVVSVHGRPIEGFVARLRGLSRVLVLTDRENSPTRLAARLLEYGQDSFRAWVCENLGGEDERVRSFSLPELAALPVDAVGPLNVVLLDRERAAAETPVVPFLHEDTFAKRMPKKGLITKREVRMLSIAAMQLRPSSVVWDVGAGSGSVAIEAAMIASRGRVYAVEVDPEGVEICRENVRAHGTDNVVVVAGRAPEALVDLEAPDAVFVGGTKGSMDDIVDLALARLSPGGRLVVNAVTLDNVAETYRLFKERKLSPDVMLVQISRGEPLATYLRYEALNPIHVFAVTKPGDAS